MNRLSQLRWPVLLLLAAAAVIVGVWLAGLAAVPLTVRGNILYHNEPIGEIRGDLTVGQTVFAPYDGLHEIVVQLADYARDNVGPVSFRVLSAPPGESGAEVLATDELQAEEVQGDVYYRFQFPPIRHTAGRQLYFELSAPAAQPGNAITAYWQPSEPYADGTAYVAGRPVAGDLVFVLHFDVSGWERARILLGQMLPGKPGPWGWSWFPVCASLGYAVLAAALVWASRRLT